MNTLKNDEGLSVLDLPQLYTKPSTALLLNTLKSLESAPPSWDYEQTHTNTNGTTPRLDPKGLTKYLTSIIASPLAWIDGDEAKEAVWEMASVRMSERAGRSGMSSMTRSFHFPRSHALGKPCTISLHEPALTADNLGFKTWASSYLLAKRLENIDVPSGTGCRVLELGAGTGLAGLAAAVIWGFSVHVTDLPEIVPNLARNVERNQEVIDENGGSVTTGVLDWSEETDEELVNGERYPIIITADPLYSPKHPELLSNTIKNQLAVNSLSRVIIELPLRDAYRPQVEELKRRMVEIGLRLLERGEETGYDDWGGGDGQHEEGLTEVKCWWGIWTRQ